MSTSFRSVPETPSGLPVAERPAYLPIADHGVVGDLRTVALVGVDGTIDWFCCPRFDSPSVFGAILDRRRGGYYRIAPVDECSTKQLYFPDTNVLITRFLSPTGVGEVNDFMPVDGRQQLIRRVSAVRGELRFRLECEPRFNYGRDDHVTTLSAGGARFASPSLSLALGAPVPLTETNHGVSAEFVLAAGETATFVLSEGDVPSALPETESRLIFDSTVAYWVDWIAQSQYTGRWREMVNRSALALKLLTYEPTGAIVAAATASLPEQLGGPRNWDYRYTWVRDASFTLYALLRLGFAKEAHAFGEFLRTCFEGTPMNGNGPLQLMYGIDSRRDLPEEILDHFEGYRGSAPVRIGNGAAGQLQLDIYGELIDAAYVAHRFGAGQMSYDGWVSLSFAIEWLCENWNRPDEGIWETRGGQKHFTHSRLMSWVALDRAIRIARDRGFPADLVRWMSVRDEIFHTIMERNWSEKRQAFVQYEGGDVLDAAVLLMPLVQFISPNDPRWLSTLDAIGEDLVSDSLVHRYDPGASPDGLDGDEGTFSICSFWYVEALSRAGRTREARLAFEKMLTYANHLGLYSEEIGSTGEALGNFPQLLWGTVAVCAAALVYALATDGTSSALPTQPGGRLGTSAATTQAPAKPAVEPTYSGLVHAMERNGVRSVVVDSATGSADLKLANGFEGTVVLPQDNSVILRQLADHGAVVKIEKPTRSATSTILALLFPVALIASLLIFIGMRLRSSSGAAFGAGMPNMSLRASAEVAEVPSERFTDVAGCDEAVEELAEIVEFFTDPARFGHLGAKMPSGVMLHGEPGTGKTLLAKALAGEAGVPFFATSGSDFVEKFVGVGASRVRELFARARKHPEGAVIFIDEIDAVGRARGASEANSEREQTLNQILVELDGFSTTDRIVCIAATNRLDVLDPALLRPGRFGRHIAVPLPSAPGRAAILRVHSEGKPLAPEVDIDELAGTMGGLSGAQLAELVNEAAIMAGRAGAAAIRRVDFREAFLRVLAGPRRRSAPLAEGELEIIACHEAGHVVCAEFSVHYEKAQQVTVEPRGAAMGLAVYGQVDRALHDPDYLHEALMATLAGRAAEQIVFGRISSGAANDLQKATELARRAVEELGFSPRFGQIVAGRAPLSDGTRAIVDSEIERMVADAYTDALEPLSEYRDTTPGTRGRAA